MPTSYAERFATTIPDTEDGVGQHRRTVAGMISAMDEGMGNVSSALVRSGLQPSTTIIFTTDNVRDATHLRPSVPWLAGWLAGCS